jgi:hypothetical protein
VIDDVMMKLFGTTAPADGFYAVFIIVMVLLLLAGLARAFGNRGRKS